jgi:ribonuclease HI
LFFDRASKANPKMASARGIAFDPEGNQEISFAWNLGESTNNQAEETVLF